MDRKDKIRFMKLLDEKEKRLCEKSYYAFFEKAWEVMEPKNPYVPNWHVEYLCKILEEEVHRIGKKLPKDKDLIINIPPRSAKSYICTVMLNAWAWIHYPWLRFISSSYEKSLSMMLGLYTRRLILTEWYQKNWGNKFKLKKDQNARSHFENDKGGRRLATSVDSNITGKGADIIIVDDLMNPKKSDSQLHIASVHYHYDKVLNSRLDDQKVGLRVIVEQRLRENDLTGHVLSKSKEAYEHICLPAIKSDNISPPELAKNYVDDLFFPERFSRAVLEKLKMSMTAKEFIGQYGQRPASKEGEIFKRKNFKFWTQSTLPTKFDIMIQSWDMTFKKTDSGSYVVGQVWGKKDANCYLVYQVRKRMGYTDSLKEFFRVTDEFPQARKKLIEGKANGDAIAEFSSKKIEGIELVNPSENKLSRANAVTYLFDAGNIFIPDQTIFSWVEDYIEELVIFDRGVNDDQVDATSQALYHLYVKDRTSNYRKFLESI